MRHVLLRAVCLGLAAVFGLAGRMQAGPLNPNDYKSLGDFNPVCGSYTINTDGMPPTLMGEGMTFKGVLSGGIAVFDFDNINIPDCVSITVTGSHPLALLSRGSVSMEGTINASGGDGGGLGVTGGNGGPGGGGGGGPGGGKTANGGTVLGRGGGGGESAAVAVAEMGAVAAAAALFPGAAPERLEMGLVAVAAPAAAVVVAMAEAGYQAILPQSKRSRRRRRWRRRGRVRNRRRWRRVRR